MTARLADRPMPELPERSFCVYGMGVTGFAVATALRHRGLEVVACDDRTGDRSIAARAAAIGLDVIAPGPADLDDILGRVDALLPAPGLPDAHPVLEAARRRRTTVLSELDLAAAWDPRPWVAVTGTNGKTTVTTLVTSMLRASGMAARDVGNTEVPLVAALDGPEDVFVVEASSFRLGRSRHVSPAVGIWLNFAADHLDSHASMGDYETSKARIWAEQGPGDLAIANLDDPVVMRHARGPARVVTFSATGSSTSSADYRVEGGTLAGPDGAIVELAALKRRLPHDIANALAAAAGATGAGVGVEAIATVLESFHGLAHRVSFVAEVDGVGYYDDSKATTPHAVAAAVSGFPSVVLVAGGRNKGLDLSVLGDLVPPVHAVVAIGEAASEIADAFAGLPVVIAASMDDAVRSARDLARRGDAVVLSPGCASFDWYRGYAERGDDFARAVATIAAGVSTQ